MTDSALKTPDQVRQEFFNRGETFASWAKKHGFKSNRVAQVLNGQTKAKWGEAHKIAVALGLKHGEPERPQQ